VIAMPAPIGFVALRDAVDAVGRRLCGSGWRPLDQVTRETILCAGNPDVERVITLLAERCEAGDLGAAYRAIGGVDDLNRGVWRAPHWRGYFTAGAIDLDLPLIDAGGRPTGGTTRCTREVFVSRPDLDRFIMGLTDAPHRKLRHPSDGPLIEEGLRAIAEGRASNPSQAAALVYRRADGPSSEQNRDRLRKAIADARKIVTAKDRQSSPGT